MRCGSSFGTTGMRLGEALGLKWDDVNLVEGRLVVQRTLVRHPGRGLLFAPPKTEKSRRTIYLSEVARQSLLHHRQGEPGRRAQSQDWMESGLVFTNARGGPVESGGINRALTRELQAAGMPHIRVHDLRHTVASILLESGVHPKIVQELLGHSTIRLTLDTYSHLTPGLHQQAARTMDLILAGVDAMSERGDAQSPSEFQTAQRRAFEPPPAGCDQDPDRCLARR